MLAELDAAQNVGTVNWSMHSGISLAAMGVAGLALGLLSTQLASPSHPVTDSDRIVLVARVDAQLPSVPRALAAARTVTSFESLDAALDSNTSVVVIDRSVAADAASGSLRELYLRGTPLLAINVSLADLYRLTGQDEEWRAVDAQFAAEMLGRAGCDDECARSPFWSLTWRSCSGDHSGGGKGPFSPPHSTFKEFDAELARQIALGPPCSIGREQATDD